MTGNSDTNHTVRNTSSEVSQDKPCMWKLLVAAATILVALVAAMEIFHDGGMAISASSISTGTQIR